MHLATFRVLVSRAKCQLNVLNRLVFQARRFKAETMSVAARFRVSGTNFRHNLAHIPPIQHVNQGPQAGNYDCHEAITEGYGQSLSLLELCLR